jgi:hypothetical protein
MDKDRAERNNQIANDNAANEAVGKTPLVRTSRAASDLNRITIDIARLIGRQLAREDDERRTAANDNGATGAGDGDDHD